MTVVPVMEPAVLQSAWPPEIFAVLSAMTQSAIAPPVE